MFKSVRPQKSSIVSLSMLAGFVAVTAPATVEAQSPFYAGKTVRIIVGSSAGGGYDTYARAMAPFLAEHLPGKPTIVVQNMPGGGGVTSVLYLDANAPKDGTAITLFNTGVITDAATKPEQARVDLTKMAWIGSATRSFRMCFVWSGSGIKTWKGLDRNKLVTFGATGTNSASYNDVGILKNVLKQNVKAISGYPGRTEVHLAMERGEVDGECGTSEGVPEDWFRDKKVNILLRFSETKSPDIPGDVPWVGEFASSDEDLQVLRLLNSPNELGRPIVASRSVPPEQIEMLRAGFEATMRDPNYLAFATKRRLGTSFVSGKEAQEMIAQIVNAPPAIRAQAKAVVK